MNHDFPKGALFPEDDLAPVTAESVRYIYQIRDLNRVVLGIRELELSLGEQMRAATLLMTPLREGFEETRLARLAFEAQYASHNELIALVKALEERMPDKKVMFRQLAGDIWEGIRSDIDEVGSRVGEKIRAEARSAAAEMHESVRRGYFAPERPGVDATFRERARFRWQYGVFKVRQFCADWLPVTIAILTASIAILTALFLFQFGKTFLH
ncbi:MAG TPA: hypothetical protein VJU59_50680 [Paraburkholderia sp.]|jgi:hypothetical protein|uniref:hypothetical protein n=1 Tax=Paraburkholderia sp. TaxID=1926495 RepID=UPI002B499DFA|nr:hypothetical protein [Paraburkholderia sp.]HKR47852.1 hypothetical protein [Paraburkholderia sp.]